MKLLVVLILALSGCAPASAPSPRVVCLSRNLRYAAPLWVAEVKKTYPDSTLVMCHGGTLLGKWFLFPDEGPLIPVEQFAWSMRLADPKRELVLVVCNDGGHKIGVPHCRYALKKVWSVPDSVAIFRSDREKRELVGTLGGMVENK